MVDRVGGRDDKNLAAVDAPELHIVWIQIASRNRWTTYQSDVFIDSRNMDTNQSCCSGRQQTR